MKTDSRPMSVNPGPPTRRLGMLRHLGGLTALCVCMFVASCQPRLIDVHNFDNPYVEPRVQRIAVAPFLFGERTLGHHYDFDVRGCETADGRYLAYSIDIGQAFAQELAMFNGFLVIPPAEVVEAWRSSARTGKELNPLASFAGARALCRILKADAIVVGEVRSYAPYEYPRIELSWQLLYAGGPGAPADDMLDYERRGQPGPLAADAARTPLYACNLVVDSREARTRRELKYYSQGLKATETGFIDSEEMIRKHAWPMYFRFASWLTLMDAFAYERARS